MNRLFKWLLFRKEHTFEITDSVYNNNLVFYTILKMILKCKMSDEQLIIFQDIINKNRGIKNKMLLQKILTSNDAIAKEGTQKYEDICILINTSENVNISMWMDMIDIAIELMLVKNLILQESRIYANNQYKNALLKIDDKLSLAYDTSKLNLPYGQRVISSLLVYVLTDTQRKTEYLLRTSGQLVKKFSEKLILVTNRYNINCNNMLSLIVTESVNQSIKSNAGQSYESRIEETLLNFVDNLTQHVHDSKISSVEYDFVFTIDNYKCGVSAKRTLRERYKQNFEDTDYLDVDYIFLITLGIDLNKAKLDAILEKKGIFVVVSKEVYDSKDFMQNNERVLSAENLNRRFLCNILNNNKV